MNLPRCVASSGVPHGTAGQAGVRAGAQAAGDFLSSKRSTAAVKDALRLGALSSDAVKHLVLCRLEGRPPRLDLELYPYLPRVRVSTTNPQGTT